MFTYPLTTLAEKLKVYKMVNMTRFQLFALSNAIPIINCLYQLFIKDVLKSKDEIKKQAKPALLF